MFVGIAAVCGKADVCGIADICAESCCLLVQLLFVG